MGTDSAITIIEIDTTTETTTEIDTITETVARDIEIARMPSMNASTCAVTQMCAELSAAASFNPVCSTISGLAAVRVEL